MAMLKATYLCARCLVDQATHAVEWSIEDPRERLSVMEGVMVLLQKEFPEKIPAELGTLIHQYVMERAGRDPYAPLKKKSNDVALDVVTRFREEEPSFRQIVLASVAGNAIDFGVDGSREALHTLRDELHKGLTIDHFEQFEKEVEHARQILYLTDNCGEAVFDFYLAETLVKMGKVVTVSPKEEPILNDATVKDLYGLGFDKIAQILPHTVNAIGLPLSEAPEDFLQVWEKADLVIAKGMGHFETLYGTDKKITFLLKAKCSPVAESLGVDIGSHILTF
jgi:uncharacterized protein with ATP-grasp and redox domains